MPRLEDHDAFRSEFYADAVATAARRAHADPGSCHCVDRDGEGRVRAHLDR